MKKLLLLLFLGFTLVGFSQTTLNVIENPTVYAGPNQAICEDEIVNPMAATASNYNSLYWTSSGDGLFTDVQALFPIYVPGPYDITSGIFVLTLTAIGTNNQAVSDAIVITIELCNTDILLNGIVSAENHQIKNVADPTDAQDAVTLAYINQLESSNEDLQEQVDNLETNLQAQIDELRNLENWSDSDGDGFTELSGDCNDSDASINPRIYEVSDGVDNNCDGFIDEGYEALDYPEDIDGNTYDFAIYGNQLWTVENAEMVTYRDGTEIPQVTADTEWANLTTGAWCYYNNDPTKPRLYNWYAVMGMHDTEESTPNKEFAPEGWRVPMQYLVLQLFVQLDHSSLSTFLSCCT